MQVKEVAVNSKGAEKLSPEELEGKIIIGEFKNETRPEYTEDYQKLIKSIWVNEMGFFIS